LARILDLGLILFECQPAGWVPLARAPCGGATLGRLRSQTIEGDCPIRRPMRAAPEREPAGPRMNEDIRVREVRLIDENGDNVGVVPIADALARATAAGLDLVEISPDANPPVTKVLDYGKYKYQEQKKAAEARKRQKIVEIKEIKMRPSIDDHDYDVKMRSMKRFFDDGDKVKVTLRFRGRELSHQELGWQVLQRVKADTEPLAKVESEPRMEGRQMVMVLAPR
jgi:translation initiation factor IF-3